MHAMSTATEWGIPVMTMVTSLIVALLSAVVAARLALRRFYSEKHWERRHAAYTALMEAMHHVREEADTQLAFSRLPQSLPQEAEDQLRQNLQQAMADLRKYRDIGSFVLSVDAVETINNLFVELDKSVEKGRTDYVSYLLHRIAALDAALVKMRQVGRRDLRLQ